MLEHQNHAWYSSQQPTWTSLSTDCTWTVQVKCQHCCSLWGLLPKRRQPGVRYTLFWSGEPTDGRLSCIGFMVSTSIASRLENLPLVILIAWCPCAFLWKISDIFSIYTPNLQAESAEKDKVYTVLCSCLQITPAGDKGIILGDFNDRVGQDADPWKRVLGRHNVGNCNDNGHLLLDLSTEQQLVNTNTIFQEKDRLKTTKVSPRSKHWHLIVYILVHKCDLKDVIHTKMMPSAECCTNHRIVHCKLKLHFKPKPRKGGPLMKKFNLNKFQSAEVKADFQAGLQSKFENSNCPEDTSPETLWDQLKSAILQTSKEVLGFTSKKNRLVRQEQPRDSRTASKEEITPPSPPGSAIMSCEIGCIPSNLQHPPVQASRDTKWVVNQSCKEKSAIHRPTWLHWLLQSPHGSVWPN